MAGFVGVCSKELGASQQQVLEAAQATVYSANTSVKSLYNDQHFTLTKSFVDFLEPANRKAEKDDVHVWVDGEIYNQAELKQEEEELFASTLLHHYTEGSLENLLGNVNGIFIAIIYDKPKQEIKLITDRYGLKPFYLYARDNCLILAPELKCFPAFKQFNLQIRKDVLDCFLQLEHLMGTATWFDGVEVTIPSAIYTYSISESTLSTSRYWSWARVKKSTLSFDDATEQLGALLDKAITSRKFGNYRVGIGLSGGFDSRAILAATYKDNPPTYTFGIPESADVRLAKQVAALAGVSNTHYDMRVANWLPKRFSGVWKTDGMLNMYHMHYAHLMDEIPKILDVNLSGFIGDGVLGSTYLTKKGKTFLDQRINHAIAQHYYGKYYEFSNPNDSFFDLDKIDIYLIYNRGRRLTGLGAEEANKTIVQRLPFLDNNLMDFSYSLSDDFRKDNRLYHAALIRKYPAFYKSIPHATSGVCIQTDPTFLHRTKKQYTRWRWILKYKLGFSTSYTDVYNWLKVPETVSFLREVLNKESALYPQYTTIDFVEAYVEPHIKNKGNYTKKIMGALTFEIWLQQILNNRFKNADL